ncbi:MAG: magnesium transporter [Clostridia bacterium]
MIDTIMKLIKEKDFQRLKPLLKQLNPSDIAEILSDISKEDLPVLFRLLPKDVAAEAFVEMDSNTEEILIKSFSDIELKLILDELFVDDTIDLIEEMPANVAIRILQQSDKETRESINQILRYPKDSAGSIMTTECISLRPQMTVEQCFDKIRSQALDKETVYTCYVTDDFKKLLGIVTIKELLLTDKKRPICEIMEDNPIFVTTSTDKEDVANTLLKYNFLALPVVDAENRLLGIVTVDDAMDVLKDEATEDISKMAAIIPNGDKPYLQTNIWRICLSRIPWLLILMVSATFTGMIISKNEKALNMKTIGIILTACIPMLMDTGGNAGSQAAVTVIRGIALNEVHFKDIFKVLWKELRISIILGAILSVACFGKLMIIDELWKNGTLGYIIAAVVCFSLWVTVIIAKLIGCVLPLVAKACKLDPAVVASPCITTIVDAVSLSVYCYIAVTVLIPLVQ